MGVAIVVLLALVGAGAIVYPLLPGRTPRMAKQGVTDADIDKAVRKLRTSRRRGGLLCSQCGTGYQAGDRFCVRCGQDLPRVGPAQGGPACPSCGAAIREDDRFCAKCGHTLAAGEVQ